MAYDASKRIYRDIVLHMNARYLTVRPRGIEVMPSRPLLPEIEARVLNHGGARTLYRLSKGRKRPVCRSLNGVRPLQNPKQVCGNCPSHPECTPQVRVDLLFEGLLYRLILAYTSAQSFLQYLARVVRDGHDVREVLTKIRVLPRGTWGALAFDYRPR